MNAFFIYKNEENKNAAHIFSKLIQHTRDLSFIFIIGVFDGLYFCLFVFHFQILYSRKISMQLAQKSIKFILDTLFQTAMDFVGIFSAQKLALINSF